MTERQEDLVAIRPFVTFPIVFAFAFAVHPGLLHPRLPGVLLIAVPDGVELVNLSASLLLTLAFVPYGIHIIRGVHPHASAREPASCRR